VTNEEWKEKDRWFRLGKSDGFKEAAALLMQASQDCWKKSADADAGLLRLHAKNLEAKAKEEHPGLPQDTDHE